ncbi:putative ribonuclease H-like domain-containing protein [Tanacetum coccineum]
MQEELMQFKLQQVWTLVDLPYGKRAIGTKWVYKNKKYKRGIVIRNKVRLVAQGYTQEEVIDYDEVFAPVARIEAIRLFLAYASFKDFVVYQMDVKSTFLYGKIEKEVYVYQPLGFEDPEFPDKFYKIKGDILLVQVYVDDIIFGSTKKVLCTEFKKLMHKKFQMSSIGELTFFLGFQVTQKDDGIFISQDKHVEKILKKFGFSTVKTTSIPMETSKPLLKDVEVEDVDVYLYRSMIRSLMYLTASRLNIMFVDSPFDLEAYTDGDYAGASLDRISITGGCQFLGSRLISWKYRKQTIVATSTIEAENEIEQQLRMKFKFVLLEYLTTDETVIKEWEDIMERAATTASSLEAEQDSGNINRTQSIATLNDSFPPGTDSGSGPRCQDIILGGAKAKLAYNESVSDLGKAKTVKQREIASLRREGCIQTGRETSCLDADAEVTLVDETQEMNDDNLMFDICVLEEKEKEVPLNPKLFVTSAATTTTTTRPKARGVVVQEPSEFKTTSSTSQASQHPQAKDKGKVIMVEPKRPLKKKDQVALDEEMDRNFKAQMQAGLIEKRWLAMQKKKKPI